MWLTIRAAAIVLGKNLTIACKWIVCIQDESDYTDTHYNRINIAMCISLASILPVAYCVEAIINPKVLLCYKVVSILVTLILALLSLIPIGIYWLIAPVVDACRSVKKDIISTRESITIPDKTDLLLRPAEPSYKNRKDRYKHI